MYIEFKNNNCFNEIKDILIRNGKKLLKIFYGANGDLYIDIFGNLVTDENKNITSTISINKNEEIYQFFNNLMDNIVNCKIFGVSDIELELCNNEHEKQELLNQSKLNNEKLMQTDTYSKLVQDSSITWYSDNIYDEKANKMIIKKNDDKITLTFVDNPDDPTFGFGIRISNSGSKYEPFNLCFMNLYNQLQFLNRNIQKKLIKL